MKPPKTTRRQTKPIRAAYMPAILDDCLCPVHSFKMYMSHLHPDNPKLGKNPLATFVSDICKKGGTSKIYTNHCLRVTNASILQMCNYSNKEIMEITRHKSVQSLTIYQRVRPENMINMGKTLGTALTNNDQNVLAAPPQKKHCPACPPWHQHQNQFKSQ